MSDTHNIYQRVNAVMKAVEYVQKDSQVSAGAGGSYKAVSHDMVTAVLRPHLVEKGIVVRVQQLCSDMRQLRDKAANISMHLYEGTYHVDLVNIDNPEDYIRVVVAAHANDTGDKSPGKCLSYAVKSALIKTFSLETGEDDEQRFTDPYTDEQHDVYHDLIETEKAYEFYMFMATLPHETQTGLHNSFPDGKKTQGKKAAAKLENDGLAVFKNVVEEVQEKLASHDISVIETTDEMTPTEKRLLMKRLSVYEVEQLAKIKKASE
jgi:hypothetical protein